MEDSYQLIIVVLWLFHFGLLLLPLHLDGALLHRPRDWFSPLLFELLLFIFLGGFRPLEIAFSGWRAGYTLSSASPDVIAPLLAKTMMLAILCQFAILLGYYNKFGRTLAAKLPVPDKDWSTKRLKFAFFVVLIFAFASWFFLMNEAGGVRNYLNNLAFRRQMLEGKFYILMPATTLLPLIVSMLWAVAIKPGSSYTINLKKTFSIRKALFPAFMGLLTVLLLATLGGRGKLAEVVFYAFVLYHYLMRPFKLRTLVVVMLSSVIFFNTYQYIRTQALGHEYALRQAIEKKFQGGGDESDINEASGIDRTMVVVRGVPDEIPFQFFTTYTRILTAAIPRAIWPDKPGLGEASVYAPLFGMDTRGKYGSYPAGTVGDFYLQLGAVGVFIGGFLGGICRRVFYEYLLFHRSNPGVVILYAVALRAGTYKLRNQHIVLFLMVAIPMFLLIKFVKIRRLHPMQFRVKAHG